MKMNYFTLIFATLVLAFIPFTYAVDDLVDYYGFYFRGGTTSYIGYQTLVGTWNVTGDLNVEGTANFDPALGVIIGSETQSIPMDGDDMFISDNLETGNAMKIGTTLQVDDFINASELYKADSPINSTAELDTRFFPISSWIPTFSIVSNWLTNLTTLGIKTTSLNLTANITTSYTHEYFNGSCWIKEYNNSIYETICN